MGPSKVSRANAPCKKQPQRSEEGLRSKKESDRWRAQTRIVIGVAFPRWRALKERKGLRADTDVALLLLDSYEKKSPTRTCIRESTARSSVGHVSAHKRDDQDDAEHQSNSTNVESEETWPQDSFEEMEVTIDEDECNSVKNTESEISELRAEGADDSSDEDVYVPLIPQRSTTSELFLECEEEELQPWQKQTSKLQLKAEDDVGEFTNDQTDYKPEPSPLQGNAANTSPPQVKTETPEPVDLSNQDFIVASPQLTSRTEFTGSLSPQCLAGNSFSVVPAQRHLFQNEAAMMSEDYNVVHTSEVYQICNNPMSLSSVSSPAVYTTSSNQLLSDQCKSQTRSVPCSMPCFTVLKVDSTKKQ